MICTIFATGVVESKASREDACLSRCHSARHSSRSGAHRDACIDARLRPTRVDRLVYIENIWSQIVHKIANCLSWLRISLPIGWGVRRT